MTLTELMDRNEKCANMIRASYDLCVANSKLMDSMSQRLGTMQHTLNDIIHDLERRK